jgi:formate dehydrogenase subunit beta
LNIHVLGLPARQQILVEADGGGTAGWLDLDALASGPAEPALARQHEALLMRQAERHHRTMEKVLLTLDDLLPRDVDGLITQLEGCGDCQRCMTVCPICAAEFPERDPAGHYPRQWIMRWMVSCAGCGMCEQACTSNLPLGVIFRSIREKLDTELGYTPGRAWNEQLPI